MIIDNTVHFEISDMRFVEIFSKTNHVRDHCLFSLEKQKTEGFDFALFSLGEKKTEILRRYNLCDVCSIRSATQALQEAVLY